MIFHESWAISNRVPGTCPWKREEVLGRVVDSAVASRERAKRRPEGEAPPDFRLHVSTVHRQYTVLTEDDTTHMGSYSGSTSTYISRHSVSARYSRQWCVSGRGGGEANLEQVDRHRVEKLVGDKHCIILR